MYTPFMVGSLALYAQLNFIMQWFKIHFCMLRSVHKCLNHDSVIIHITKICTSKTIWLKF